MRELYSHRLYGVVLSRVSNIHPRTPLSMTKDFPLNLDVPGFPSTSKLLVSASTEPDVLAALVGNLPFPDRQLDLGKIGVDFEGQTDTPMDTGMGAVSFQASAHSRLGRAPCLQPPRWVPAAGRVADCAGCR